MTDHADFPLVPGITAPMQETIRFLVNVVTDRTPRKDPRPSYDAIVLSREEYSPTARETLRVARRDIVWEARDLAQDRRNKLHTRQWTERLRFIA